MRKRKSAQRKTKRARHATLTWLRNDFGPCISRRNVRNVDKHLADLNGWLAAARGCAEGRGVLATNRACVLSAYAKENLAQIEANFELNKILNK